MNSSSQSLGSRFTTVRSLTVSLTDTLATEDTVIQSMPATNSALPQAPPANTAALSFTSVTGGIQQTGAYAESSLWLSDGWALINDKNWNRPLYWDEDLSREYTLAGVREIDPNAPVSHVSNYEADAYARWQFLGFRLAEDGTE